MNKILVLFCTLSIMPAVGDIYSYQDADGHTVYTDQPPIDVKSKKVTVSPVNQLQVDKALQKKSAAFYKQKQDETDLDHSMKVAQKKAQRKKQTALQKAKKRLEAAKEIRAGDVFPNKSGGFRYTAQYKKRLAEAEAAVEKARKSLSKKEKMPH